MRVRKLALIIKIIIVKKVKTLLNKANKLLTNNKIILMCNNERAKKMNISIHKKAKVK